VQNLTQLLAVAGRIADALTVILMLVALVTLLVSGIGIMNIMLATVTSRIREIGIRKAIGATNARSFPVSSGGDPDLDSRRHRGNHCRPFHSVLGAIHHRLSLPNLGALGNYRHHRVFGGGDYLRDGSANRASQLDPVESLRYE